MIFFCFFKTIRTIDRNIFRTMMIMYRYLYMAKYNKKKKNNNNSTWYMIIREIYYTKRFKKKTKHQICVKLLVSLSLYARHLSCRHFFFLSPTHQEGVFYLSLWLWWVGGCCYSILHNKINFMIFTCSWCRCHNIHDI